VVIRAARPREHTGMKTITLLCAVPAVAFAGCGSSGTKDSTKSAATPAPASTMPTATTKASTAPKRVAVRIAGFAFKAPRVTIRAGGSVVWTNTDSTPHTATVTGNGTMDTGTLKQGKSKALVFTKPGTYRYVCGFHPYMHGVVVVQ
jgi:plastocyanin